MIVTYILDSDQPIPYTLADPSEDEPIPYTVVDVDDDQ